MVLALPYRVASPSRIDAAAWLLVNNDLPTPLPQRIPQWDYLATLRLRREIVVDVAGVRQDCVLSEQAELRLVAVWRSMRTNARGCLAQVDLPGTHDSFYCALDGNISGSLTGGEIRLETRIVLASGSRDTRPLAPSIPGSILWRDSATTTVDAELTRFPVELVDFGATTWAPPDAGWFLSWNRLDFDLPFLSAVRLYLNARHETVIAAAVASSPDAVAAVVRSAIYFDVARSLIYGALSSEEFIERADHCAAGSAGWVVRHLIQRNFPGHSLVGLRDVARERPHFLDAELQNRLRLFWT